MTNLVVSLRWTEPRVQTFLPEGLLRIELFSSRFTLLELLLKLPFLAEIEFCEFKALNFCVIFFSKFFRVSFFLFSFALLWRSTAEPLLEPVADRELFLAPRADSAPPCGISG